MKKVKLLVFLLVVLAILIGSVTLAIAPPPEQPGPPADKGNPWDAIHDLQDNVSALQREVSDLWDKTLHIQDEIGDMQANISNLQGEVVALWEKVNAAQSEISELWTALLWTDADGYIYPNNVGTSFQITDTGNLYVPSNVGIGTTTPGSKLTVAGLIESTTVGIKFPDGTIQTTAAKFPSGMIAMFDTDCPCGWTRVGELDGRFLMGGTAYNPSAGGSETHTHTVPSHTHNLPQTATKVCIANRDDYVVTGVSIEPAEIGETGPASNLPPYATVVFCRKD